MCSSRQGITKGKYKTKAIQGSGRFRHIHAYSGISRHIQAYLARHNQAYSGIFRTLCTLTYSEPWYIQNTGKFRTRGIFRTLAYSEFWFIQKHRHIQSLGYSKLWHILNSSIFRTLAYS